LAETAPAPSELHFSNAAHFRELLGQHDEHIRLVERETGVRIDVGEQRLTFHGDAVETELARRVLGQLYTLLEQGYPIYASDVDYAIRILSGDRARTSATSSSTPSSSPPTSASSRRRASARRRTSTPSGTSTWCSG
jgi:phosphate starvation-inducible protein PhoH